MKNKTTPIQIIITTILLASCGVKAPPQPPLSPEQEAAETADLKAREEKREKQRIALDEQRKKKELENKKNGQ